MTAKDKNGNLLFNLQIRPDKTGLPFYLDVERLKGKDYNLCLEHRDLMKNDVKEHKGEEN